MIKLNDNSLFIGQIKQLLKDFNLPRCLVGSKYVSVNNHYIDGNFIYFCSNDSGGVKTVRKIGPYVFNQPYSGLTTNLQIRNLIYDRYTHRYLGDYLRFLKDYKKIDLMSMYNCFDEEINDRTVEFDMLVDQKRIYHRRFEGIENGYVTYSIPVRLGEVYTLGIQSPGVIETCLTFNKLESWAKLKRPDGDEGYYSINEIINTLGRLSYEKHNPSNKILIDPFKWLLDTTDKGRELSDENPSKEYIEGLVKTYFFELRLLLKLPVNIKSSITLLVGDYLREFNINNKLPNYCHKVIISGEKHSKVEDVENGPIPGVFIYNPSLMSYHNSKNYLISDRLLEYLVNNPISSLSEDYDVIKAQKYLTLTPFPDSGKPYIDIESYGSWTDKDTWAIRSKIIMNKNSKLCLNNYDLIGYVDKIVEDYMTRTDHDKGGYLV